MFALMYLAPLIERVEIITKEHGNIPVYTVSVNGNHRSPITCVSSHRVEVIDNVWIRFAVLATDFLPENRDVFLPEKRDMSTKPFTALLKSLLKAHGDQFVYNARLDGQFTVVQNATAVNVASPTNPVPCCLIA